MKSNKQNQFINPANSKIKIHILQPWTIATKSFQLPFIHHSANNLKFSCRMNSFTYNLARVLKSCKRLLRYLIYSTCLFQLAHNLAKSFKITCKQIHLGTRLRRYKLGQFNNNLISRWQRYNIKINLKDNFVNLTADLRGKVSVKGWLRPWLWLWKRNQMQVHTNKCQTISRRNDSRLRKEKAIISHISLRDFTDEAIF